MKFRQIQTAIAQGASFQPPPEAVTTIAANNRMAGDNQRHRIGWAVQGVTVSADLSRPSIGSRSILARRSGEGSPRRTGYEPGTRATGSGRGTARSGEPEFRSHAGAVEDNVISRAEYEARRPTTNRRKRASARFVPGTIASDHRALLRDPRHPPGERRPGPIERRPHRPASVPETDLREFGVPQQATAQVRVGREVRITTVRRQRVAGAEFQGRITAIDSVVNSHTRNFQVQATLANPEGRLRPGMFVQVEVALGRVAL